MSRLLAIEVGGTFTDAFSLDLAAGEVRTAKVPSTPRDPALAVQSLLEGPLAAAGGEEGGSEFLHGSTVATNALLERKGADVALVTSEGMRDVLELQRGDKRRIYDLLYEKPKPLIRRSRSFAVSERLGPDGAVRVPLDEAGASAVAERIAALDLEGVAVCTLHSYANPEHEQRIGALLERALPAGTPILLSSDLVPQFREYERANTTVMSAYIAPRVSTYLDRLEAAVESEDLRFFVMQSNGGVVPPRGAAERPINTFLSGPAAGVIGAAAAAGREGVKDFITLDMGGTSTDVSVVRDGRPQMVSQVEIDGLPIQAPAVDMTTVGAGGGSLAWTDRGGMLRVGPRSAGADPGPVCYGWGGTEPTVTDANVVTNIIRGSQQIGGQVELQAEAAAEACASVGEPLGLDPLSTADSILRIADQHMIGAIRLMTTERGLDPRDHALVAFGGAGPLHAARLARDLGIPTVIVPQHAGLLSAYGLAIAPIVRHHARTAIRPLAELTGEELGERFAELEGDARAELSEHGYASEGIEVRRELDVRYHGQGYELTVAIGAGQAAVDAIAAEFHAAHRQRYGYARESEPVEVVNWRVIATIERADASELLLRDAETGGVAAEESIYVNGEWIPARFLPRADVSSEPLEGPVVIEEPTSATFVPAEWTVRRGDSGSLILTRRDNR
ncbi:MAG: hydantoinase/oxoprolinase family protein [Actinobacteria bacterium]|nr:hydantoinase/oxoprolinase family protein [Actinomycetota bacterium]